MKSSREDILQGLWIFHYAFALQLLYNLLNQLFALYALQLNFLLRVCGHQITQDEGLERLPKTQIRPSHLLNVIYLIRE